MHSFINNLLWSVPANGQNPFLFLSFRQIHLSLFFSLPVMDLCTFYMDQHHARSSFIDHWEMLSVQCLAKDVLLRFFAFAVITQIKCCHMVFW